VRGPERFTNRLLLRRYFHFYWFFESKLSPYIHPLIMKFYTLVILCISPILSLFFIRFIISYIFILGKHKYSNAFPSGGYFMNNILLNRNHTLIKKLAKNINEG